ncbi:aldolase/citrate lyase family protein [bacterium RCC_150]
MGGIQNTQASRKYYDFARYSRSHVLLTARSTEVHALDSVYIDLEDTEGLQTEAIQGADSGFSGKACIHPGEIELVRATYRPNPTSSRGLERCWKEAGEGASRFGSQIIDGPLILKAGRYRAHPLDHLGAVSPALTSDTRRSEVYTKTR